MLHSAEACSVSPGSTVGDSEQSTPEDLALVAARSLLSEIVRGGCVDRGCESLVTTMMTLGTEGDVVRCLVGGPLDAFL